MSAGFNRDLFGNGLRLMTVEMPHLHSAEMHCYVGVGSRHEGEADSGISHFLEHMLFRGTAEFPDSHRLEQAFEAIGGMINASTDAETTCYHSRFHPDCLEECARLFASLLRRPRLNDLEIERRIVVEEALEDYNEQGEEINPDNLTSRLLWPGHALSRPTIGTRESLVGITEERLKHHHQQQYVPMNVVIAVAGAIERERAVQAVRTYFDDWIGGQAAPAAPWDDTLSGAASPSSVWVRDSDSQVGLQFAFRLPGRDDSRQMVLRVLRRLLSGSGTSRLTMRLREQLGLTYNIEANLTLFADSGCLSIDLAVAPENLGQAADEVLQVLATMRCELVGEEELARVLRGYLFDLEFSQDHADEMAIRHGWGELVGCLRTVEDDRRALGKITPEMVQQTAYELLAPQRLKMAVVGPYAVRDRERVEKLLADFGC